MLETTESSPAAAASMTLASVVAGFTPTVASIVEQNSLELLESSSFDYGSETPPPPPPSRGVAVKPASTVPDVVYDEHGQTWDVYGAEFDPVILGQAIQSYLEKIIARKAQAAAGRGGEQPRASSERLTVEEPPGSKEDLGRSGVDRDGARLTQMDRALGFVMRYLCARSWRRSGGTAR